MALRLDPDATRKLFDEAISSGAAPGFQYCAFDKERLIINDSTGLASLPSDEHPSGRPMRPEDPHWIASASKIATSIVALIILDRKLAFNGMSMQDLDSHEKLVEIIPEFDHNANERNVVTKILTGFKDEVDASGKKIPIYQESTSKMTLRMLLTHTSGIFYAFTDALTRDWQEGVPFANVTGKITDFTTPLRFEPGSHVGYGHSGEWLGVFATRATGKNFRRLLKDLIFEPLGMPAEEVDHANTAAIVKGQPTNYLNLPEGGGYTPFPVEMYSEEGEPPPGYIHFSGAGLFSSAQTYSKLLRAVLRHDPILLSEEAWTMSTRNDLEGTETVMPKPRWKTAQPFISCDVYQFRAPRDPEASNGINLLQCEVATGPSATGWPTGTFAWAGLSNSYYALDPVNKIGYMFSCQILPFYHPKLVKLRDDFEKLIHSSLSPSSGNS